MPDPGREVRYPSAFNWSYTPQTSPRETPRSLASTRVAGSAVTLSGGLVGYPVFSAQAMRYALAAVVLVVGLRATGRVLPVPRGRDWIWLVLLAATGQGLYNVAIVGGVTHAEPAAVAVVVGLVPVVLTLAEAIRRRARPPTSVLVGVGLVVAGASLVQGGGHISVLGIGWALLALGCEAAFTLLALPILGRLGPLGVATHTCWIAAAQLGVLAVLTSGPAAFPAPSAATLAAIIYLAVVVTAIAFVLWYEAVQRLGASRAGLFAGLIPVAAAISGLGAGLTTSSPSVLGGTVLVGAGIVTALPRPNQSEPSRPPRTRPLGRPLDHTTPTPSPVNATPTPSAP